MVELKYISQAADDGMHRQFQSIPEIKGNCNIGKDDNMDTKKYIGNRTECVAGLLIRGWQSEAERVRDFLRKERA